MVSQSINAPMKALLAAILADDRAKARAVLKAQPEFATSLNKAGRLYQGKIFHWFYVGDTALHLAAAGYRVEIVRLLLAAGADPHAVANRRQSGPLHYASDGSIDSPAWNAKRQRKTLEVLLDARADINAPDKNGATPLHRAVRTRCAAAVKYLLERGADAPRKNKSGSTPFHLAVQNTGRGGSGTETAKAAQREIIESFLALGLNPNLKDGTGKSVLACAKSAWIRDVLLEKSA